MRRISPTRWSADAFSVAIALSISQSLLLAAAPAVAGPCDLFPIALSIHSLSNAAPGSVLSDVLNGAQPGNFGWLIWGGSPSESTLANSLTAPGDSSSYVNPDDPADRQVSSGNWIQSRPGISNSKKIRGALDALKSLDITVPVWDQTRGSGDHAAYRVAAFARVRLTGYQLPGQNRITAQFLGYVTCDAQNLPPTVNAGPDQTLSLPATATLSGAASDDGLPAGSTLTLTWSEVSGPGTILFADAHAAITTATVDTAGTYLLRLTATDSQLSASDDVIVTVNRPNVPPVAAAQSVVTNEDASIPITLEGSDADGDALSFIVVTLPQYGTLSGTPPQLVYSPKPDYNGPDSFQFKVNDGQLDSSNAVVSLQINPVNDPPIADPQSLTNFEDATIPITLSGSDIEGSSLIYTILSGPTNGTLSGSAPALIYTPTTNYFGTDAIVFKVSDGALDSAPAVVGISIGAVDDVPLVDAGPDQLISLPTNTVQLTGSVVYDVFPGTVETVFWTQLSGPAAMTFADSSNELTTAVFSQSGVYEVRLSASDSILTGVDDVEITVNAPPVVYAGPNRTNNLSETIQLTGFATDDGLPTNSVLTVTWSKLSGSGSVIFADANATNTIATFSQSGIYLLRLTASDGLASTSGDVVVVMNGAPTVDAGSDQTTTNLQASLNGTVFDDGLPPEIPLSITWSEVSGPAPVEFVDSNALATAVSFSQTGVYVLRLTADDSFAASSADVVITVKPANQAPAITMSPPQLVVLPGIASLSAAVTDDGQPDGEPVSVSWSKVSGPGDVVFANPVSTNTSASFTVTGDYILRLVATDTALTSDADVRISVRTPPVNAAPIVSAGPDKIVGLTNVISLEGSVADDGLPTGSGVTVAWMLVSGPGTAIFGNSGATNAHATFSAVGTYVLRLTATDSALSATDEVVVTVYPFNQPPLVDAGPDQDITIPDPAAFDAISGAPISGSVQLSSSLLAVDHWNNAIGQSGLNGNPDGGTLRVANNGLDAVDGRVYVAGGFTQAGNISAHSLAAWDGTNWHAFYDPRPITLSGGLQGTNIGFALTECDGFEFCNEMMSSIAVRGSNVFAAGSFKELAAVPDGHLDLCDRWSNGAWEEWGFKYEISGGGVAVIEATKDMVYLAGGPFVMQPTNAVPGTFTNLPWANCLATWDGTNWSSLGSGVADINDYPIEGFLNRTQPHAYVTSLAVASNGAVYVAGLFTMPTPTGFATNIAKWNGQQWEPLGAGLRFTSGGVPPTAIAIADNGDLYVGGSFADAGGVPARNIARWDGIRWWPLGDGPDNGVNAAVEAIVIRGRDVYVGGGSFVEAGGVPAWRVARWNGEFWSALGTGSTISNGVYSGSVHALAIDETGLYVGGQLTMAGGMPANNIAKWEFARPPPRVASLRGRVVDDGLPPGAALTVTWTKVNGPGEVMFSDPHNSATTAAFTKAGTYLLRLSANDSEFTTLDEVTIVVRGNQPPAVNAGPDIVNGVSEEVVLQGSVTDDGLPAGANVACAWSVVNGPGTVTFGNVTASNSFVRFSQQGIYVLRFTANDTQFSVFDDVVIVVTKDNSAPSASPGPSRSVPFGSPTTLSLSSLVEDGTPINATNILWSQLSGPGIATFSNPTNRSTAVNFSIPGVYVVRLNLTDTELSSFFDVTITVTLGNNTTPLVNAGPNLALTNLAAKLEGSVRDDGLPAGAPLTVFWSKVSGPGTVSFSDSNSPVTWVTFSKPGGYVLNLNVTDSLLSNSDSVVISMPNQAPIANAGPDRTIIQPTMSLLLTGTGTDDGLLNPSLTASWTKVSGPGTVTFSPANAFTNTATFSAAGTYVLRLFAIDGGLSGSDDLTVVVAPPGNQPPMVNAGPDVTLNWPNTNLTLAGSIADDGLPAGSTSTVLWSKVNGPAAVSFANSASFNTVATFTQPGTYTLRLTGNDSILTNGDDLIVQIFPPENQPPVVSAGSDQTISAANTLALSGTVTDDGLPFGGSLETVWQKVSGPGPVYFASFTNVTTNVNTTARFIIPGNYVLRLSGSDSATSTSASIVISVLPPDTNQPPLVSAGPDVVAAQYAPLALEGSISDDGLPQGGTTTVNWSKISGPGKAYFGNASRTNSTVLFYTTGSYVLRLTVTDGSATAYDDITVTVAPPINGPPLAYAGPNLEIFRPNPAALGGAVFDDDLPAGYPLAFAWSKVSGPGAVIFEPADGVVTNLLVDSLAYFSATGEYVLRLTANDSQYTNTDEITVTVYPGTNAPPLVNAGSDQFIALPQPAVLQTDVSDDGLENGQLEISWSTISGTGPVSFSAINGIYRATFVTPGDYVLRLTADDGALTNSDDVAVTVYDAPPPVARIDLPLDAAIITCPSNIFGTASSSILQSYVLECRLSHLSSSSSSSSFSSSSSNSIISEGEGWSVLTSNTVSVVSNTLGILDPTLSLNGLYELRLTVTDLAGRSATTDPISVIFDRNLKIGHFALSFSDLAVPVPGVPLQVVRTYDSRAAAAGVPGDFGVGWTMDIRNVRLQKNRPLGRNWVETATGNPFDLSLAYHLDPINPRVVTITFPDGRVEKFRFDPNPLDQPLQPIGYPRWSFKPLGNTRGTLEPASIDDLDGEFLIAIGSVPGTVQLYDLNFFFDALDSNITEDELQRYPTLFRYTSAEGYRYLIDEIEGLQSVTDPNGNTLLIGANGLTWTNAAAGTGSLSILFQRDAAGRITNIVDAAGHAMRYDYDANGNLARFVNRDNETNTFTYDEKHRLVTLADAQGVQILANRYNGEGRLVQTTDALGNSLGYFHDLDARREFVTNRLGFVTVNEYDERGNIVRITDPTGAVSSFVYDPNGNLLAKSNVNGCACAVLYTYDDADNRISETDAQGNTTTYTYNHLRKILTTREPSGFKTTNTYDLAGNLLSTRDSAGQFATFTYNSAGKVLSMTDSKGSSSYFAYNEFGFLTNEVNALGHVTDYTVDANGNMLSQAMILTRITGLASLQKLKDGWLVAGDPVIIAGPVTNFARLVMRYEYSPGGLPLRTLYYDGSSTENTYVNDKLCSTTDALGRVTSCTRDAAGNLIARTHPDGCQERFSYDTEGHLISSVDKRGFETRFENDPRGKLVRTIFADGSAIAASYYADGSLQSETSKTGEITTYGLDADGNRISVTDASGVTHFKYNYRRHATSKIDPLNRTSLYQYDELSRNTAITYPDNSRKTATFFGRLVTSETDQNGHTTSYVYDALGRLASVTDALGETTSYAYDEQGNKIAETDPLGRTTFFEYDLMRHRTRTIYPDGSATSTTYDAAGRALTQTDQLGNVTTFEYDLADHVTKVTDPLGRVTQYTYDCGGNKLTQTGPDDLTTSFEYDTLSRRTRTTFPDGTTEQLEYDQAGRMIAQTDQAGKTTRFAYDIQNYLTAVTDALGQTTRFDYDAVGNRITETDSLGQITHHDYDALNRIIRTTYPDNTTHEFTYDPTGRLIAQKDQAGKTSHFTYDAVGRLLSATDPLGHTTTYAYDTAGDRIAQTDPNGKTTRFEYDVMNRRTRTILPDGSSRSMSYDKIGLPVAETDALDNSIIFDFDAVGERTLIQDALGHSTHFAYDVMGRVSSRTDADNQTTRFEYDVLGRLTRTVYPDGTSSSATYDARGRRISQTDANGHTTRFSYDDLDRLTEQTDALEQVTKFSYDSLGRLVSRTDANNHKTTFEYDALGRLTRAVYPDGTSSSATYDAKGRLITRTDSRGHTTTFAYDDADRLVSRTDPLGHATEYAYDAAGRLTALTDANGHTTGFEYDDLGRLTRTVFADGTARENEYDLIGRRIRETDQAGAAKRYGYDAVGRLTSVTDALNQPTQFAYDPMGRLISQTDANNHTTIFDYDALGRRTKRILPGGQSESLGYDPAGNLITRRNFNGHVTTYTYDALNRLTEKQPDSALAAAGAVPATFEYNPTGQRTRMTDAAGTTDYTYDVRDRLVQKSASFNVGQASSLSLSLSYSYDANGNPTSITSSDPNGTAVLYEYDELDRLSVVNDLRTGRSTYTYDPAGNLIGCAHPNSLTDVYAYDSLNHLTSLSTLNSQASTVASYSYTLGPAGHRLSATETLRPPALNAQSSTLNRSYTYDPLYRLTTETIASNALRSTLNYAYDPVGNRLTRDSTVTNLTNFPGLPNQNFAYDANDRLASDQYDANGNTKVAQASLPVPGTLTCDYDFEDHLTRAISADGTIIQIVYDGDGNRVAKTITTGTNSTTTYFLVDDLNPTGYAQVLEERASLNSQPSTLNRVFTHGLSLLSEDQLAAASGPDLQWVTSFYGTDGHGDVRYLTDLAGVVTDTYDYDAFGNLIAQSVLNRGTGALELLSTLNQSLSTPNRYLFAGEQFDPDLGLYYLRARYAEAGRGRFWTADTFEGFGDDPPSLHKYTFNQNDPVNRFDPSGHLTMTESLTVSGLAPMVRKTVLSLFDGVNNFSYGLAGGNALKFKSRGEAYMIDSLAVGPGWKFGQPNFWAAVQGAPFLLTQNPDIFQGKKPCWYECVPFDLDADVYGPEAKNPLFEMEPSELLNELTDTKHGSLLGSTLRSIASQYDEAGASSTSTTLNFMNNIAGSLFGIAANAVSPQSYVDGYKSLNDRAYTVMLREFEAGANGPWAAAQGVSSVVGDLVGYNNAFEAGFGVDRQQLQLIGAADRWTRGFTFLSQAAALVAGGLEGFNPEFRSLRLSTPRALEPSGALVPNVEPVCARPPRPQLAIQERVRAALAESRAAREASRFDRFEERLAIRDRVEANIANSRVAREASEFEEFKGGAEDGSPALKSEVQLELGFVRAVERQTLARDFYRTTTGWSDTRIASHLRGIDFNHPVSVVNAPAGTRLVQYQLPSGRIGNYFAPLGTPANKLGFYTSGMVSKKYILPRSVQALQSTAAAVVDDWSMSGFGWRIQTQGGGQQLFIPNGAAAVTP